MQDQPLVLRIQALGVPEAHLEGTPLHFPTKKALALLLYLAVTGTPQPREHLAALFWPDREDERARSTLRSTLRLLRQTLTSGYAAVISSQPEGASEPSQSTDPSRPGGDARRPSQSTCSCVADTTAWVATVCGSIAPSHRPYLPRRRLERIHQRHRVPQRTLSSQPERTALAGAKETRRVTVWLSASISTSTC